MTGAVTVAALVGLLSLLAGVALGWYLRRTNDWCPACGEQLACDGCGAGAAWPRSVSAPATRPKPQQPAPNQPART